jgi:putative hydrolase of the HAD superfamily
VIRAVTVDFWGTLILEGPRSDDRYRERRLADFAAILEADGLDLSHPELSRGYECSGRELAWIWGQNRDVPAWRHVASILEGARPGLSARVSPRTLERLVEAYARPALLAPPGMAPGAPEALAALAAAGLRLAVVSNTMRTPGSALRRILAGHGLLQAFQTLTFSDEAGVRKPAPEIFRLTLEALGVPPGEAVHVGDDPVLDVGGARGAGMRVIQVAAPGADERQPAAAEPPADLVVTGFDQVPAAVARLARGA